MPGSRLKQRSPARPQAIGYLADGDEDEDEAKPRKAKQPGCDWRVDGAFRRHACMHVYVSE